VKEFISSGNRKTRHCKVNGKIYSIEIFNDTVITQEGKKFSTERCIFVEERKFTNRPIPGKGEWVDKFSGARYVELRQVREDFSVDAFGCQRHETVPYLYRADGSRTPFDSEIHALLK
jgi:hypothetical protein